MVDIPIHIGLAIVLAVVVILFIEVTSIRIRTVPVNNMVRVYHEYHGPYQTIRLYFGRIFGVTYLTLSFHGYENVYFTAVYVSTMAWIWFLSRIYLLEIKELQDIGL